MRLRLMLLLLLSGGGVAEGRYAGIHEALQ